jgi:hypothetical protein
MMADMNTSGVTANVRGTNPGIGPGGWNSGALARAQEKHAEQREGAEAVLFRLYTESKPNLPLLASRQFRGFSITEVIGYYDGLREAGAVIEVVTTAREAADVAGRFARLSTAILEENEQTAVIVYRSDDGGRMVTYVR